MSTVKIIVDKDESFDETEELLIKAFSEKKDQEFIDHRFDDHLMNLLVTNMDEDFRRIYSPMMSEIIEVLKSDY